ncbi:unnamed protein product [Rotaria sp. Silwood1]|nr:unnamed protein product [Rotaria sp. Silwood1]
MSTTDESEAITNEYLTSTRNMALQSTTILTFGELLIYIDEPHKAQKYFESILIHNKEFNAPIYHILDLAYAVPQDFSKALDSIMLARELFMFTIPSNFQLVAYSTSSIARILYH